MIMTFLNTLRARETFDESLDISPYAKMMGFRLKREQGRLITGMAFHPDLVGSPMPPALHGGTLASLMEMAALMELIWTLDVAHIPKAIDITTDFLRSGKPEDTFAKARVYRQGRRYATLHAEAWQSDMEKPIATAMLHFQLVD